jgi:hypothetical protein
MARLIFASTRRAARWGRYWGQPNARVQIFPDAGHGSLFQRPVEFANVAKTFLNHHPAAEAATRRRRSLHRTPTWSAGSERVVEAAPDLPS